MNHRNANRCLAVLDRRKNHQSVPPGQSFQSNQRGHAWLSSPALLWLCAVAMVVSWLPASRAIAGETLMVGAATEIITPDPLLPVSGGFGPSNPVKEKRGELTARAVVFQKDQTRVAIVSLDLLGFPGVLADRVRKLVDRIPADHILAASTHTHSGPDCYAFPDGKGGHTGDLEYMESVCQQAAKAINRALDSVQPAKLKIATDEAKGKIAYNYYAPDLYDRRMSVIQAIAGDNQPIVTLVNYALHPEVLGSSVGILSPDLVGPLCEKLEAETGGEAMFVNGAIGGMVTADNRDLDRPKDPQRGYWHDDRTWEECLRIGHTMADEALRMIAGAEAQADPPLACHATKMTVPVESDDLWGVVVYSPLKYPHNADDRTVATQVNLIELGNARILSIPGEALPNIGFYLKRKMGGQHQLLFGLTNDAFGYILTKVDFRSFPRYDYVSNVSLGEMTGEILIDTAMELIEQADQAQR